MPARTWQALALVLLTMGCGTDLTGPRLPVATIELTAVSEIWVGDTYSLLATPRDSNGTALPGRAISWSSSNDQVASIDASGRLSALAIGTTTITATSEGKQSAIDVAVSDVDLLYEGFLGGFSEMLVLPRDGQPTRVLPEGFAVMGPVPSPDGSRIAFVATETPSSASDIYVVNRDGTGLERLTSDSTTDDNPSWSPDGTKIAFRSFRALRSGDIWVMNADGSNAVNLTPDALADTTHERRPAWSPDGTRIAFASNRGGSSDIWTMRADGTDAQQLTNTVEFDTEPSWSPDGGRIAFRRSDDTTSDVLVISASGGFARRLTFPGHELMPSWSLDGSVIAFAYFRPTGGKPQIYTVRPDGGDLTLRTTDAAWNGGIEPRWMRK